MHTIPTASEVQQNTRHTAIASDPWQTLAFRLTDELAAERQRSHALATRLGELAGVPAPVIDPTPLPALPSVYDSDRDAAKRIREERT